MDFRFYQVSLNYYFNVDGYVSNYNNNFCTKLELLKYSFDGASCWYGLSNLIKKIVIFRIAIKLLADTDDNYVSLVRLEHTHITKVDKKSLKNKLISISNIDFVSLSTR